MLILGHAAISLLVSTSVLFSPSWSFALTDDELRARTVAILRNGEVVGTGFMITDKGHILTAGHVLDQHTYTATIRRYQETKLEKASVLSVSDHFDIALLSIVPEHPLLPLKIGDSDLIRMHDSIRVIGNPSKGGAVSEFLISAMNVKSIENNGTITLNGDLYPGNSGGPALNKDGQVIGVVLKRRGSAAEGFVLPILYVQHFLLSGGIWIEGGQIAFYGSELALIKKQLNTYNSMYAYMTTDLKWDANVIVKRNVASGAGLLHGSEGRRQMKVSYEKRFQDQAEPLKAHVKVFPVIGGAFDKEKAVESKLYIRHVLDFEKTNAAVIEDIDSAIEGIIAEYNEGLKASGAGKLKAKDIKELMVEIVPESNGSAFSKSTFRIEYFSK